MCNGVLTSTQVSKDIVTLFRECDFVDSVANISGLRVNKFIKKFISFKYPYHITEPYWQCNTETSHIFSDLCAV